MTVPLKVGRIPYANLAPIFHFLPETCAGIETSFIDGHPSGLNTLLRSDRLDISPNSSIEYAVAPDLYLLCPGVSIASHTRVMSVLLLSNTPLSELSGELIGVTSASDTSVALLDILFAESLGRRSDFERTDLSPGKALEKYRACLSIGDEALRASVDRVAAHVTDLGQWWKAETGKPFVFSLWIASRKAWESPQKEPLGRFCAALLESKRMAKESISNGRYPWGGPEWMPAKLKEEYWNCLSYDLDDELEGLALFYRLAEKYGLIPFAPPLRFLEPARHGA
ncbi:MAG: menaquinone biosynthesis protein [Syntrophorhabdaceae bacterium]|nr:menaquinone biosynthesis protein [Syntrophorhabdaceae bacterium]